MRGLMPVAEWMPHRKTRAQVFDSYEALQRTIVEDWELIINHLGSAEQIPDLCIGFNGLLAMLHGAMFQAFSSETRRRARNVVSFFAGKHAQLFHATTMLRIFDEHRMGDNNWAAGALDVYLNETVGLSINDKSSQNEVELAGLRLSRSSAMLCQQTMRAPRS